MKNITITQLLTPKKSGSSIPYWLSPAYWFANKTVKEINRELHGYKDVDLLLKMAELNYKDDEEALRKQKYKILLDNGLITQKDATLELANTPEDRIKLEIEQGIKTEYVGKMEIIDLTYEPGTIDHQVAVIRLKIEHNRVPSFIGEIEIINLLHVEGTPEHTEARLKIELEHDKISQQEHDKAVATLKGESWVDIVEHGYDPSKGVGGVFFRFDWNEFWISELRDNGYSGTSDEELMDQWFSSVCMAHLGRLEEASTELDLTPDMRK